MEQINSDLNEALWFEVVNRLKNDNENEKNIENIKIKSFFEKINFLKTQLQVIGHLHSKNLNFYRLNKFKMKLPYILSEIYEIDNGHSLSLKDY